MDEAVPVKIALSEGAILPSYQSENAAGMDLRCSEDFTLYPNERRLVGTGLRVAIPPGYEGKVRPRSGLALKRGLSLVNSPGTIDADYRGEIGVILINHGADVVTFNAGDRIAQLVICPVARAEFVVVDQLDETERGEGGFGSTGGQ
jgi:dUTP pyrophosphatase